MSALPWTIATGAGAPVDAADAEPVPIALRAFTVTLYAVPFVSPVMVQERAAVVQVRPPGTAVAVYPVIALPPSKAGDYLGRVPGAVVIGEVLTRGERAIVIV